MVRLEVPERTQIRGEVVTLSGQRIVVLFDRWFEAGTHSIALNLAGQSSGVYFVVVRGGGKVLTRKVVLLK
jgi:hypothetical protein